MTGRHRGQPEAGRAEEREPKRRRTAVIGALVAVPLLAAVVAFTLGDGSDGSSRAVTPVQRTTPAAEPTYGEYVAPEAGPQAETLTPPAPTPPPAPAATPRSRPAPAETPRTRQRRDCRWEDVPVLERWCRWRGRDGR
ncbi:hypothetical protein [Actinomadura sp. WMMB 499]|uniref:hypothetical protein n=1 Tax=Actinomadura sp. WMMB 499 TaxID=1219491 RepID=UPI001248D3DB|nr:hypothetical protein [Actinomadura sp. WMMB 499]QFG21597.1 hypothetical protein F7P10_11080 [Actinomadura sp. WMMB 499]